MSKRNWPTEWSITEKLEGNWIRPLLRIYRDGNFDAALRTTQFAFEDATNDKVYGAGESYRESHATRAMPNAVDGVFRDGYEGQLLALRGNPSEGYEAVITAGVAA